MMMIRLQGSELKALGLARSEGPTAKSQVVKGRRNRYVAGVATVQPSPIVQ